MRTLTHILGLSLFFTLNSCSQDFSKLKASETDKEKTKIATEFAISYLNQLKEGSYYQFNDNAIPVIMNQLTEANQKAVYKQLKGEFGDFIQLEYAETWIQGDSKAMQIIRCKGDFKKSNKKLEIRVVLNEQNKIAGFWIKPWSDMLN